VIILKIPRTVIICNFSTNMNQENEDQKVIILKTKIVLLNTRILLYRISILLKFVVLCYSL